MIKMKILVQTDMSWSPPTQENRAWEIDSIITKVTQEAEH